MADSISNGNIVMNPNVDEQFRDSLQPAYDYLNNSIDTIDKCSVLNELNIKNSNSKIKSDIGKLERKLNELLNYVSYVKNDVLDDDERSSQNIDPDNLTSESGYDGGSYYGGGGYSGGGYSGGSYYYPSDDNQTQQEDTNEQSNDENNSTNNSNNELCCIFSTNVNDMINAGDPFANEEYSLTLFTNYLLTKNNITDENIAKKIYKAMLDFGNAYAEKNNGANPLKTVSENDIITEIYNILSAQKDFDITKYNTFFNDIINKTQETV